MTSLLITARLSFLSGVRSRAMWLVAALTLLSLAASFLAGAFSARQPLIVSLDVGYTCLRFSLLFLALVWTQELFQKELDKKTVQWALAYPIERSTFLVGKMAGIAGLLLVAVLLLAAPLWLLGSFSRWGYAQSTQPYLDASIFACLLASWLESLVILAVTFFMVTLSTTPFLAVALGLLFSFAGRGVGAVLDFLLFSPYAEPDFKTRFLPIANILRWILPDLSALDWRQVMLYGHWQGLHPAAALAVGGGYALLFAGLAMICFRRRALT